MNYFFLSGDSLQLFKLCDKMQLTSSEAIITMATLFPPVFGFKILIWNKILSKVSLYIYLLREKLWLQVQHLWLTENLGVISTLENIRGTEMYNH